MKKILWFRRDLRVDDVMLLSQKGDVLPIFIFDKNILNTLPKNDKRVDFIYKAVINLKLELQKMGLDLAIFYSTPLEVFRYLKALGFDAVYASVDYDAYARRRDKEVGECISFFALNDSYLFEPNEVLKSDGTPYRVFTPYYHACKQIYTKFHALSYVKEEQNLLPFNYNNILEVRDERVLDLHVSLESLGFTSLHVKTPSPLQKLEVFKDKIATYAQKRDFLDEDASSHLSVDLRFGTLSIRHIVRTLIALKKEGIDTEPFFRQLIFRDFYAYLLYHFPNLAWENYKYEPYTTCDERSFEAFCTAQTGYPLIDAAIMELLHTGDMHNRTRMIVGSFFTKHLMLPWQKGEAFFAKHLMDYDASANVLSWQWCAGTGIDPQPYFRIFNPYAQSKKFDKNAVYIKKYLPLLHDIPAKYLHDETYLLSHTITGYPKPLVKHDEARKRFLSSFC